MELSIQGLFKDFLRPTQELSRTWIFFYKIQVLSRTSQGTYETCKSNSLGSRRPAQAGVKDGYPHKWLFYRNYLV